MLVSCHYPTGTFLDSMINRYNYVEIRIICLLFSIKLESQFCQLSSPHLFSFSYPLLNIKEVEVTFAIITDQLHLHHKMDIDTIAENQTACSVKLGEGNQNNSARFKTLSAGTNKVFGKSKINL